MITMDDPQRSTEIQQLLIGFFTGKKRAADVLVELSSKFQRRISFNETTSNYCYGNFVTIDHVEFPKGLGKSKKQARAAGAQKALALLLNMNEEELNPNDSNRILIDSHGNQLTEKKSVIYQKNSSWNEDKLRQFTNALIHFGQNLDISQLKLENQSNPSNAVQRLMDFCKTHSVNAEILLSIDEKYPTKSHFAQVKFGLDQVIIAHAHGSTVFQARSKAAERAMRILDDRAISIGASRLSLKPSMFDQHCQLVSDFIDLQTQGKNSIIFQNLDQRFYAAFILKKHAKDSGNVVAFAAGSRCTSPELIDDDGMALVDCHAIPLVRRALLKYFYRRLNEFIDGESPVRTIFINGGQGKFHLKHGVSIHLVVSDAPNGDAREFLPVDTNHYLNAYDATQLRLASHVPVFETPNQGQLRYKYVEGLDTIDTTHRQEFGLMSCSDKILKWNVLGVQGALLSQLTETIKIASITHLSGFKQQHTSRAYCCRLGQTLSPISVHHPQIGRVKSARISSQRRDHQLSYVWFNVNASDELIDGSTGRLVSGHSSQLCKGNLLQEYKRLCLKLCHPCNIQFTYHELKKFNKDYFHRKQSMIDYLEKSQLGCWSAEKIHFEQFRCSPSINYAQKSPDQNPQ